MEVYRNSQFRICVSQVNVHGHRFSPTTDRATSFFYVNEQETETHFIFECFSQESNTPENISQLILMNIDSQEIILNVAKFLLQ